MCPYDAYILWCIKHLYQLRNQRARVTRAVTMLLKAGEQYVANIRMAAVRLRPRSVSGHLAATA